jgi:Protein of unknown function (DUF4199)
MKTCALYGCYATLASAVLLLAIYFMGFHSDVSKLPTASWIGNIGGLAIGISVTILGIKARREEVPATESFGYGRAFVTGFLIHLVAAVLGSVVNFVYFSYLNPGMCDLIEQAQIERLEAKGLGGAQLDQAQTMIHLMTKPPVLVAWTFFFIVVFGTILSLIAAAFLKRPAPPEFVSETSIQA